MNGSSRLYWVRQCRYQVHRGVPMNGSSRVNESIRNGRRATYIGLQRLRLLPRSVTEGGWEAQLVFAVVAVGRRLLIRRRRLRRRCVRRRLCC